MLPDTKLAALCDTETGAISAPELVTNGTFDVDTSGWSEGPGSSLNVVGGALRVSNTGTSYGYGYQAIPTEIGKTYVIKFDVVTDNSTGTQNVRVGTSPASSVNAQIDGKSPGSYSGSFIATSATTYISLLTSSQLTDEYVDFNNISVKEITPDRSGNNNHLNIIGTLNRQPIGNGEIAAWSGFDSSNYLTGTVPTGGLVYGWEEKAGVWTFCKSAAEFSGISELAGTLTINAGDKLALLRYTMTTPSTDQLAKIKSDERKLLESGAVLDGNDPAVRALAYDKERDLLHVASQGVVSSFRGLERVESTLDGVPELVVNGSNLVDTSGWLSHNFANLTVESGALLVTNTATAAGYASQSYSTIIGSRYYIFLDYQHTDGGILKVGTTLGGNDLYDSGILSSSKKVFATFVATTTTTYIRLGNAYGTVGHVSNFGSISFHLVSSAAPFTSLSAQESALILSGEGGVDVHLPEVNIRERLAKTLHTQHPSKEDFEFTGDGTETTFTLNYGWKPKRVWVDGVKKRQGSAEDYTVTFDGFRYSVMFAVAPALNAEIDVEGVSV
jgi:hypothetical protein